MTNGLNGKPKNNFAKNKFITSFYNTNLSNSVKDSD